MQKSFDVCIVIWASGMSLESWILCTMYDAFSLYSVIHPKKLSLKYDMCDTGNQGLV